MSLFSAASDSRDIPVLAALISEPWNAVVEGGALKVANAVNAAVVVVSASDYSKADNYGRIKCGTPPLLRSISP